MLYSTGSDYGTSMGLNELQTLLRDAVKKEDFDSAIKLRDILAEKVSSGAYSPKGSDSNKRKMKRLSWKGLGTAPWYWMLSDINSLQLFRLKRLRVSILC